VLALDGARLRRSLGNDKIAPIDTNCRRRRRAASPTVPMARKWPGGESELESAGSVRTIGHDPSIILSVSATNGSRASPSFGSLKTHTPLSFVRKNFI